MKPISLLLSFYLLAISPLFSQSNKPLQGAWQHSEDSGETVCLMDGYFVFAKFDVKGKIFYHTWGGPFTRREGNLQIKIEFDSKSKERVGRDTVLSLQETGNGLKLGTQNFNQVDDGNSELAGNWRITGRKQGETMNEIPLRPRRTLKLLTGTRFQWMAINTETGEFSGTGGGTYTFANGKYTEHIEFFSRDNNRVGASLQFEGRVENGNWHHSGLSSRGEPIYEIWSRGK